MVGSCATCSILQYCSGDSCLDEFILHYVTIYLFFFFFKTLVRVIHMSCCMNCHIFWFELV
ncbi:hypothetical protein HanIR_Chr13g0636681 [Helianthus annuus]|nr:hypothetical protein HanIR_Chr13g0636681 [Helianthus annuus]